MAEAVLPPRPNVFSIPAHRSFADALASGLVRQHGSEPMALAGGRILLPNARAVRTMTEAFVRASGSGLVLPRLIAIGDPELDDRIGGALDPLGEAVPNPPAIDPLERQLALAALIRRPGETVAESMRLAADLARALDQLIVEEIDPARLAEIAADRPELAVHWQASLERLQDVLVQWPIELARRGLVDMAERRNRLLRQAARRWAVRPPAGFTVAAGITTSVPAVAALLKTVAFLPDGMLILPGLAPRSVMDDEEWDALGPDEDGRGEESHPQFHLKLLLDRVGIGRDEVAPWRSAGRSASPPARGRAALNAMATARFSDKWSRLAPPERRLAGVRAAEFADPASEALGIAIAIREALETPERTVALVTPDRALAARVSGHLGRWGVVADDSAGRPMSQTAAGTLLLAAAAVAAEDSAPVPLLALLKHPLAGIEDRLQWLSDVRTCDLQLRGPRPSAGLDGLDHHFADGRAERAWSRLRPALQPLEQITAPCDLAALCARLVAFLSHLTGNRIWTGADGRALAELLARLQSSPGSAPLAMDQAEWVPVLRMLLDEVAVRAPYGGHPRVAILGLIEARLQQADLMILAGLNEGIWPALPAPDPWLAPKVRALLGLPGLDFRIGLAAHDFTGALGAPSVLVTRARRDSRAPTVASRLWLRLEAMTGGLPRDRRLEHYVQAIDDPGTLRPAERPHPAPPAADRPRTISVTDVDRLKADPFAFYAKTMLRLRPLDPVDADQSAAWKGTAVHTVLEEWFNAGQCEPADLLPRARALIAGEAIHPMLRALWQPRLLEAIDWIADQEAENRAAGRAPAAAEKKGATTIAGIRLEGRADRIDSLPGGLAIIDYKTGQPPKPGTIDEGFALQLGLLGLIARDGGFEGLAGTPRAHEYWSLARKNGKFGFRQCPDAKIGSDAFLARTLAHFVEAAAAWLTGTEPFTAKLNPAYAPYGDYDQLMRLDEWYGREPAPISSAS